MQRKRTFDQTLASWSREGRMNRRAISVAQKANKGGAEDIPLSATEVVAGATTVGLSMALRFSPKDKLRGLTTPSISRISNLCSSTFCLSYLVCCAFTPPPRARSIPHICL